MPKQTIEPPELFPSRPYGFSQVVVAPGGRTVYISGQVGWDAARVMAGPGDLGAQTRQALRNVEIAVRAAGGSLPDVVSLRIYIVGERLEQSEVIQAALKEFFPADPPAATWVVVQALANPDFLIEIEPIAVIS